MRDLAAVRESWPLAGVFNISRGSKSAAEVVVATVRDGAVAGRGEAVPYARYGETVDGVLAQIAGLADAVADGLDRAALQTALPPGAARNALDCALWDLEAKRSGTPAWRRAGLAPPRPFVTAYTLSLDDPEAMGRRAAAEAERPVLKLKLNGDGDLERVAAVHANAPAAALILDANEAWAPAHYEAFVPKLAELGVALLEQPFPADRDAPLADLPRPVPVCADESAHDRATLDRLVGRYDVINVKLDKTGGLTEALALIEAARDAGLRIMLGCMVGTSLAMAPAALLAGAAEFIDLDGPLWLARDRPHGLVADGSVLSPPEPELWG